MISRILAHARQKLNFTAADPVAKRLAACKRFLRLEDEMIRMRHRAGDSGSRVALARSTLIDVLLQRLFAPVIGAAPGVKGKGKDGAKTPEPPGVALVALGGYGRAELCPLSDIDIMLLFPE